MRPTSAKDGRISIDRRNRFLLCIQHNTTTSDSNKTVYYVAWASISTEMQGSYHCSFGFGILVKGGQANIAGNGCVRWQLVQSSLRTRHLQGCKSNFMPTASAIDVHRHASCNRTDLCRLHRRATGEIVHLLIGVGWDVLLVVQRSRRTYDESHTKRIVRRVSIWTHCTYQKICGALMLFVRNERYMAVYTGM